MCNTLHNLDCAIYIFPPPHLPSHRDLSWTTCSLFRNTPLEAENALQKAFEKSITVDIILLIVKEPLENVSFTALWGRGRLIFMRIRPVKRYAESYDNWWKIIIYCQEYCCRSHHSQQKSKSTHENIGASHGCSGRKNNRIALCALCAHLWNTQLGSGYQELRVEKAKFLLEVEPAGKPVWWEIPFPLPDSEPPQEQP